MKPILPCLLALVPLTAAPAIAQDDGAFEIEMRGRLLLDVASVDENFTLLNDDYTDSQVRTARIGVRRPPCSGTARRSTTYPGRSRPAKRTATRHPGTTWSSSSAGIAYSNDRSRCASPVSTSTAATGPAGVVVTGRPLREMVCDFTAEVVAPPTGPGTSALPEETELVLRWLEAEGTRLVDIDGEWTCPVGGAASAQSDLAPALGWAS